MHRFHPMIAITFSGLIAVLIAGCGSTSSETAGAAGNDASSPSSLPPDPVDFGHEGHDHGGHDHPSEGPHHGHLIELGGDEYHAELVHDEDAGTVTIYILDADAKEAVPIDAAEIAINLKHDGKGEQFKLTASPDNGDPEGMSSRFVSNEKELAADLDGEGAEGQLVLKIDGKSFRGKIEHDHEHGHDHEH